MKKRGYVLFYATKQGEYTNKRFKLRVTNEKGALGAVYYFIKHGNYIKAAWYQEEYNGAVTLNYRINVPPQNTAF